VCDRDFFHFFFGSSEKKVKKVKKMCVTAALWPCCEPGLDAAISQRDNMMFFSTPPLPPPVSLCLSTVKDHKAFSVTASLLIECRKFM